MTAWLLALWFFPSFVGGALLGSLLTDVWRGTLPPRDPRARQRATNVSDDVYALMLLDRSDLVREYPTLPAAEAALERLVQEHPELRDVAGVLQVHVFHGQDALMRRSRPRSTHDLDVTVKHPCRVQADEAAVATDEVDDEPGAVDDHLHPSAMNRTPNRIADEDIDTLQVEYRRLERALLEARTELRLGGFTAAGKSTTVRALTIINDALGYPDEHLA